MLNKLWLGFFLTAAAAALYRWLAVGDPDVFRPVSYTHLTLPTKA